MDPPAPPESPAQRRDRWAWRVLHAALLTAALGTLPHAVQERQRVARALALYEVPNANFTDAARRISTRYDGGRNRDDGSGLIRFRLQRERGLWDAIIAVCAIIGLISGWKLGRPLWQWWRGWFSAQVRGMRR